ncbi:MAG TPA: hypothetical protein VGD04_04685, partial [Methylophilus sp.]
ALEADLLPDLKDGIASAKIQDPDHDVGYTVGDILTRNISITVKKPYVLVPESLPIVGYERRYKGQLIGIDLSALQHSKQEKSDYTVHNIVLSYQVFTTNVVAKPGALPAEYVRIFNPESKDKAVFRYRIPSWNFTISPLSVFGQVKVETEMSGYRGPLLLDASPQQLRLKVLLSVLGLSLLGLLYMLGKYTWLPGMGGPFAKAYKIIKKAPKNTEGLTSAVEAVHTALNNSAGYSVFNNNLATFLSNKPAFNHVLAEIEQFFKLSNSVFFAVGAKLESDEASLQWLAKFCKQCRDCERGLIPDSVAVQGKA